MTRHPVYYGDCPTLASFTLKKRGHLIIDQIEAIGLTREKIYHKLARRMGSPLRAHFSQVADINTLNKMVKHLDEMLEIARRPNSYRVEKHEKKKQEGYKEMFTDKAVLREVGLRNRSRDLPKWRQWLMKTCAILFV